MSTKFKKLPRVKNLEPMILRKSIQNLIMSICEGVLNLKVVQPIISGGVVTEIKEGKLVFGEVGQAILEMAPIDISYGSASIGRYKVRNDLGSCLQCVSWDGTTEGPTAYIAKPFWLRKAMTSTAKMGNTYAFTYSNDTEGSGFKYLVRTSIGSDGTYETQDITPPYILNDEIYAITIPTETLDSHDCVLLDINADGREWATR